MTSEAPDARKPKRTIVPWIVAAVVLTLATGFGLILEYESPVISFDGPIGSRGWPVVYMRIDIATVGSSRRVMNGLPVFSEALERRQRSSMTAAALDVAFALSLSAVTLVAARMISARRFTLWELFALTCLVSVLLGVTVSIPAWSVPLYPPR